LKANESKQKSYSNDQTTDENNDDIQNQLDGITDEDELIRLFISNILKRDIANPLFENLQSGVLLCEMVNAVVSKNDPNSIIDFTDSRSPFIQRENIEKFIRYASKYLKPFELFETEDLFSLKNLFQVRITIYALSREWKYQKLTNFSIGPEKKKHISKNTKNKKVDNRPVLTFYESQRKTEVAYPGRRQITVDMLAKNHESVNQ
ncbi:Calponin-1, partial [Pseudoloma neurophilia]